MDFRAMLMKKKTKQKKVVVEKTEWIEPLFDIEAQEKRDKQVDKQATPQAQLAVKDIKRSTVYINISIVQLTLQDKLSVNDIKGSNLYINICCLGDTKG